MKKMVAARRGNRSGKALAAAGRLAGRRILVTGASSGMGRAIAKLFAAEGAKLTLVDWNGAGVKKVARDADALAITADVSSPSEVEAFVAEAARRMGGLDGIVNAAGIYSRVPVAEVTPEVWHKIMDVNLTGPFMICRAAERHLQRARGATIVNISSIGPLKPTKDMIAYVASKGGMIALSRALAVEFAPRIRVNTICPGTILTAITEPLYPTLAELRAVASGNTALQRIGEPEEIAHAALFLTTPESSYVTGIVVAVDGGRSFY
jgi:NAD(P)-dependent dehydrogenase (short-subunit alcohol dehydrogenase family)